MSGDVNVKSCDDFGNGLCTVPSLSLSLSLCSKLCLMWMPISIMIMFQCEQNEKANLNVSMHIEKHHETKHIKFVGIVHRQTNKKMMKIPFSWNQTSNDYYIHQQPQHRHRHKNTHIMSHKHQIIVMISNQNDTKNGKRWETESNDLLLIASNRNQLK